MVAAVLEMKTIVGFDGANRSGVGVDDFFKQSGFFGHKCRKILTFPFFDAVEQGVKGARCRCRMIVVHTRQAADHAFFGYLKIEFE